MTPATGRRVGSVARLVVVGAVVVGASATGVQLAAEIHRSGRPVTLSVGDHVRLPRTYRGRDIFWWLEHAGVLAERIDDPDELARTALRAGAVAVQTRTEELTAAFLGWPVRTFEAAVRPGALGWGWAMFAYGSWRRLSALDRVLARAVPAKLFYNVGITGVKPG